MRSFDDFERLWQAAGPAGAAPAVRLICLRKGDGVHECPARARLSIEHGIEGDRWTDSANRDPESQVTLMNLRVAELVAADAAPLHAAGDNFLVDLDLAEAVLPAGTRLRLGSALLEITSKPHIGCKKFRERFGLEALRWVNDDRPRRLRGVNCRVVAAGEVALGDAIEIVRPSV